jgi:HKD family nuclease
LKSFKILAGWEDFTNEFKRCCEEYNNLQLAVAWCGNPNQTLPYEYLQIFKSRGRKISATIGTSFYHTHPDAIQWLLDIGCDVKIFSNTDALFHPKVYFFKKDKHFAIFIGSSNFTYGGFYSNIELNTLIEGDDGDKYNLDIKYLSKTIKEWHSNENAFKPKKRWLNKYEKEYKKANKTTFHTPPVADNEIGSSSWLKHADWKVYYRKINEGMEKNDRDMNGYLDVLNAAKRNAPLPWIIPVFNKIENRRIIGGMSGYGWLGHVAASIKFRSLLANGPKSKKAIIINCVNQAGKMRHPIDYEALRGVLQNLCAIKHNGVHFKMRVWGRLLSITRPDLYCTISSDSVRKNLSTTLKMPQNSFDKPEGYIRLLKILHNSPWFTSAQPVNGVERKVWKNRIAFMDVVFYDE